MDEQSGRREVLAGALGVGATMLSGCVRRVSGPLPEVPPLPPGELEATLKNLDLVVGAIQRSKPDPVRYGVPQGANVGAGHALMAKTLSAMHVMGTFGELPERTQLQPEVQRRMWRALPDVHDAMMSMTDWLDALGPEERRRIDAKVRKDGDLPMRIAEQIDADAKRVGVPASQRTKLRALTAHLAWRLRNQGTGPLVDELVGKVDRVIARHGADAELQRAVAAKVAEAQLFGMQLAPGSEDAAATPVQVLPPPVVVDVHPPPGGAQVSPARHVRRSHSGRNEALTASLILWGCVVVAAAIGGILIGVGSSQPNPSGQYGPNSTMSAGLVLFTVAGVLAIAGLITLIVAAVIDANQD